MILASKENVYVMRQVSTGKGGGNHTFGVNMHIDSNDNTLKIVTSSHWFCNESL